MSITTEQELVNKLFPDDNTKTISDVILQFKEIFTQHLGYSNVTDNEIITMIKNSEQKASLEKQLEELKKDV